MSLGLPSITIAFKSTSITAITRSQRGIVAMIIKETALAVAGKRVVNVSKQLVAGDTISFNGITFAATTDKTDATNFAIAANLATTATNIAAALNDNSTISALYTAAANSGDITVTEKIAGNGNTPPVFSVTGTGTLTQESITTSYSFASPITVYTTTDVPDALSADNQEQIELCLKGYQTPPKKILVYVIETAEENYNAALLLLENARWDYLVIPGIVTADVDTIATWIKTMRSTKDKMVKAVLPHSKADSEGIVNFTNTTITTASKTYTTAQYCSRIAGLIAGTPMTISCTFASLSEVVSCDIYTKEEMDTKIAAGEFFIMYDGTKYKVARGVNSFVTTIESKGGSFKKVKLIDAMDMIHDDIKTTANDSYIGKYSNSYDHKCLLISAIQGYFDQLELDGILDRKKNSVAIDTEQQRVYLLSNGDFTQAELAAMKDQTVNEANTRDQVFLAASIKILDAIEDIKLGISI